MPAPGDQYTGGNVQNPFSERVVNGFTAQEIATLQSRLNKQLGPEYISQRPGNGGGKVAYLEGNKAIALANEVFGFNGWSSSLGQVQIDYVDESPQSGKVSLGLSIVVRITLKDGTYHEDIGYGSIENGRGKAASFEKAKKEAATDGLKRALRTFGNVLGNCLYDKEYLKKVQAMKVQPVKFKAENLHRHAEYAQKPNGQVAKINDETATVKKEALQTPIKANPLLRTRTEHLASSIVGEFDDEFDGNLFDGVEITDHGEEFTFETTSAGEEPPKVFQALKPPPAPNAAPLGRNTPVQNGAPARAPNSRMQPGPPVKASAQLPHPPQQHQQSGIGQPNPSLNQRAPQTPLPAQNNPRSETNRPRNQPQTTDIHTVPKPLNNHPSNQISQQPHQNQTLRPTPPQAQIPAQPITIPTTNPPTNHRPPIGFVTSRAAELVQNTDSTVPLSSLPAFNPHAESPLPKEQRTPGLDHTRSVPVKRQDIGAPPPAAPHPLAPPNLSGGSFNRPSMAPRMGSTSNFVNPHQDTNRRIGMPGGGTGASPSVNRSAYRPPMKRPPLQDVSNQPESAMGEPEAKKQRVEGVAGTNGDGADSSKMVGSS